MRYDVYAWHSTVQWNNLNWTYNMQEVVLTSGTIS